METDEEYAKTFAEAEKAFNKDIVGYDLGRSALDLTLRRYMRMAYIEGFLKARGIKFRA